MDTYPAPCGLFSFQEDGTIRSLNATLCDWLRYRPEELIGQKIETILTLPSRIFYQTHLFPLLAMQDQVTEIFITLQTKDDGHVPVLLTGQKHVSGGVVVYACACITVYHRKKFEDELVAARQRAQKALQDNTALQELTRQLQQRSQQLDEQLALVRRSNSELTQFSRVVTHELQEPLRKISVFSDMLLHEDPSLSQHHRAGEKLLRATGRLRSVINGLQQYIWLQEAPAKHELLNWSALLGSVQQQLIERFGNDLLELSLETGLPEIAADREQMELLFTQILSNAIQFKKEGLPAQVSISGTEITRNRYTELTETYEYDRFLKIDVADKGVGFDPGYKDQIFGLFSRLHRGQQEGIGLALCKIIVEKHGGTITAYSQPGAGTTITILLPIRLWGANTP